LRSRGILVIAGKVNPKTDDPSLVDYITFISLLLLASYYWSACDLA